jgi:hypothetical protein
MSLAAFSPPEAELVPWNWNPAQTFINAYNTQRILDQENEKMRMSNELEKILFPAKVAKAEYDIKKLGYDSQLLEKIYRTQSAALDNSYRGINSAVGGGGSDAPTNSNDFGPFTRSVGSTTTPPAVQSAPGRKLGENLQPKQP